MREIKFRGKKILGDKKWSIGSYIKDNGLDFIVPKDSLKDFIQQPWDTYIVAPDTIGQYTGLKDSEGREIYEGDIISSGATTGIVMYDCEQAGFIVQKEKAIELRFYSLLGIKVIGNIHDNPELLER